MSAIVPWKARWGLVSIFWSVAIATSQLGIVLLAIKVVLPGVWARQMAASPLCTLLIFLAVHFTACIGEWPIHRYGMHMFVASGKGLYNFFSIYLRHCKHHLLTFIAVRRGKENQVSNQVSIESRYPVLTYEQNESISFPNSMLWRFYAIFTGPLIVLQWAFPHAPFLVAGYSAVTWSYILYDALHVLEHKPDAWWDSRMKNPIARLLRPFVEYLARFHGYHHLYTDCNMAIAGFFGYPLADRLFGTYKMPKQLLNDGTTMSSEELAPPNFPSFVKNMDRWARGRSKRLLAEVRERQGLKVSTSAQENGTASK